MNRPTEQIIAELERFRFPEDSHFDFDADPVAVSAGDGATLAFVPHEHFGLNVLWGADSATELISGLERAIAATPALVGNSLRLEYVPAEFEQPLTRAGFRTTSEWVDSWLANLAEHVQDPTGRIAVRAMTPEDAPAVGRVTRACRYVSRDYLGERDEFIVEWLSESPNTGFMALVDGHPAGVALTTIYGADSPKGPVCWLRELAVAPAFQRRGIGRELALTVLQWGRANGATRSFLHVDRENPAVRLYESLGYELKPGRGQINMMAVARLDGSEVTFEPA